ncbi:hypothetical protein GCM10020370_00130 [Paenibacillus hodogayensis]
MPFDSGFMRINSSGNSYPVPISGRDLHAAAYCCVLLHTAAYSCILLQTPAYCGYPIGDA